MKPILFKDVQKACPWHRTTSLLSGGQWHHCEPVEYGRGNVTFRDCKHSNCPLWALESLRKMPHGYTNGVRSIQ
jgi:hypothetical protein